MLNQYSLRLRMSLALSAAIALAVLASALTIYKYVENATLRQAEASLLDRVRDTALSVRLLSQTADSDEKLQKMLGSLRAELKKQRLLETGYYYILDGEGRFVLHPAKEGEPMLNATDLDGRAIFKEILAMDEGQLRYRWLNAETKKPQEKVAVCKKVEKLNWSVCASLNQSEIYAPVRTLQAVAAAACVVLMILGAIIGTFAAGKLQVYLLTISKRLLSASTTLGSSISLISNATDRVNQNATQQGAAIHETISAVEEIRAMSERNAENSGGAATKVREAVATAAEGQQAVQSLSAAIGDIVRGNEKIQRQTEITNQQLGKIVGVIREIDTKTKVINDIVFQTKLLSFNASVEAARAGENGKGFAVVAEEIGSLAAMSGKAAQEISSMLASNIEGVEKLIKETQESIGKLMSENKLLIERGSIQAADCGKAFSAMESQIRNIEDLSGNIEVASREQARGVEEISASMRHLNEILDINKRISLDSAAASEDLSNQSSVLGELAHELAWSLLGAIARRKMDPETEKAIDAGLLAHSAWKSRLIRAVSGTLEEKLDPEAVCLDDRCDLGKWLYGKGAERFGKYPEYATLKQVHSEFHKCACGTLKKALNREMLNHKGLIGRDTDFERASHAVIRELVTLKFLS